MRPAHSGALLQIVRVGAGAKLDFFEHYASGDDSLLFGQRTAFHVAENAQLRYFAVQRFGSGTLSFAEKEFRLENDTKLSCFHADLGARLSRTAVDHHFEGRNAKAPEHSAVFFGSAKQHFDLTTRALHHGTGTQSNILVKGALKNKASSVYRGLIRIDKNARRTDSYLQDRVLHVSKGVKSNSIPSLIIDNNDVKASHGATVSKLNDESLFYLRSRGLPKTRAEELVVQGFLNDVVRRLPHDGLRQNVADDIERKVNG
ncbi:SufD family Fe-S cluster assembly protein [Candidatus Micrarchaeota archaeon]|nr:SufD family Fe-S cluster assembly protein [Candidatus Micrarchaeota archaeon]